MFRKNHRQHKKLHNQAYQAFDAGNLQTAADKFAELAKAHPDNAQYRYMLGLAAKYRMDWALSLQANLAAIACAPEFDEAAHWNAAIAATALHDWQTVRQLWAACGIPLPEGEGEGEIEADFGTAVLRLNPWADGECVYARRIDPCRSRIINIPPCPKAATARATSYYTTAHPPAGAPTAKAAKSWYSTHWNVGGSIRRQLCPNLSPFNGLLNGDYFIPLKIVCRSLSELIN